ncbi:MAG: fibronectin type III domain-containing protein, partial [Chloroflexi bacterium]|nr:fibronectin type III domain-containing protein [Chloroflexota bacterium]
FDWPQVVFDSADQAGNAVAVALQDATCTFTVAPTPTPSPTPTPTPAPRLGVVTGIRLTPGDASIDLFWASPASEVPITDFRSRCRTAGGDWIESTEGASTETTAVVEGLTNGAEYECEVTPVGGSIEGEWTAASAMVTPIGPPAAPGKPAVEALDGAISISVTPDEAAPVPDYHYQCSSDKGATWPADVDLSSAAAATTRIGGLANGTEYVCRAFASNASGLSDASAVSDAIRPCSSMFDCNPLLLPIVGLLALIMVLGLLAVLFVLYRGRTRGYVVAVVDVVYTTNLGHGSNLGIRFIRDPATKAVTGIVADPGSGADFRIRNLRGGSFEVADRVGRHVTASGERLIAIDSLGGRHDVVLRAFDTNTAAEASSAR